MIQLIDDRKISHEVASKLLSIGAIKLSPDKPFIWSSGWHSPIYCDNRLSLSYPEIRSFIKDKLAEAIKANFAGVEAIAGVATAGIPQGALVAEALGLPFLYVRAKPKGHGMENMIEGLVTPGQKVVLIEDLVSTGGSSLKAAEALDIAGFEVMGMVAIFTYGFDIAQENFENKRIPLVCLSDYQTLIEEGMLTGKVTKDQVSALKQWRDHPQTWGK